MISEDSEDIEDSKISEDSEDSENSENSEDSEISKIQKNAQRRTYETGIYKMNKKVLIVDDDQAILNMVSKVIRSNSMDYETATSGEEALYLIDEQKYDLMLLDINMSGIDGFEVIKKLREENNSLPIIVISGRKDDYDALYGMEIGADDYIFKPFNPVILGAKVKALVRRSEHADSQDNPVLKAGPFEYNTSTLRFYKNGTEISLSSKESALIKLFLDNVGELFTKDSLYDLVWGSPVVDENTITVYINRLRQKIEDDPSKPQYIVTVRGLGYRFVI